MQNKRVILFYDGDCGLCNRSVQFILNHEQNHEIHFAALQSEFAQDFLKTKEIEHIDYSTMILYKNNQLYTKSDAAFQIVSHLKWYWRPLFVLKVFPRGLRNLAYEFIAARRKKLIKSFCALPTPQQAKRFMA